MSASREPWWRTFFESTDSFVLSCFPEDGVTDMQVEAIVRLLSLRQGDSVADICCGHGRHLLRLTQAGIDAVGLDVSAMMLHVARELAREAGIAPPLVQGFAQALPFEDAVFDAALNLFNSMGYMDDAENRQMLAEIARCLKPGGRFLLDTRNKKFQILFAPYRQIVELTDGSELTLRCRYDQASARLESFWSDPDDDEEIVYTASIRLYRPDEIEDMLTEAGFDIQGRYSGYDGTLFAGFERQLIYCCTKRPD